jgi:hypothetical protein
MKKVYVVFGLISALMAGLAPWLFANANDRVEFTGVILFLAFGAVSALTLLKAWAHQD